MMYFLILLVMFSGALSKSDLEKLKEANYKAAIKNEGLFQYFTVIEIKDLNTGISREVCTKGNFLHGAIHREYKLDYGNKSLRKVRKILLSNSERRFEFSNEEALKNISINGYSEKEYMEFEKKQLKFNLLKKVRTKQDWQIRPKNDKEMKLYAHFLFNNGILTGEFSCEGGRLEKVNLE